jgi:hypothetical protein
MSHSGSSAVGVTTSAPPSETSAVSSDFAPWLSTDSMPQPRIQRLESDPPGRRTVAPKVARQPTLMMTPPLFREALCLVSGVEVSEDVAERPTRTR